MAIVQIKDIKKKYRQGNVQVEALRGVDLTVHKGEFVALAGPSGSGKTTLLNIIGGLDQPDQGSVVIENTPFSEMNPAALASLRLHKIGFVFQAYNLIPVLSAIENVEYVMLLQGVPRAQRQARAKVILDDVGLQGTYHRRPAELSGGQQQRVAVARAIVSGPAIILADEPTANLDSKTGEGLLLMMKKLNTEKKVTFIFSTHDSMVMEYAGRLVTIKDGRIVNDEIR